MTFVRRMNDGSILIILTPEQADVFVNQGHDSASKGNDLLYPIFEEVDAIVSEPRCDICGQPEDQDPTNGREYNWNGETGNHLSCEAKEAR
jgi:hypothetical protein